MTFHTQCMSNTYPYFWIPWWKVMKESYVFGWLPCTLEEIELFLLVILCHDFSFFLFWMIFWLRQLCRENLANKRALITCQLWQTETGWEFEVPSSFGKLSSDEDRQRAHRALHFRASEHREHACARATSDEAQILGDTALTERLSSSPYQQNSCKSDKASQKIKKFWSHGKVYI